MQRRYVTLSSSGIVSILYQLPCLLHNIASVIIELNDSSAV